MAINVNGNMHGMRAAYYDDYFRVDEGWLESEEGFWRVMQMKLKFFEVDERQMRHGRCKIFRGKFRMLEGY